MQDPLLLLLVGKLAEPPFAGVNRQTQRPYARVTVAGRNGSDFEKISIRLPGTFDVSRFKDQETWIFPLKKMSSSKDRVVYYELREDPEAMRLLQRVPDGWTPSADEAA